MIAIIFIGGSASEPKSLSRDEKPLPPGLSLVALETGGGEEVGKGGLMHVEEHRKSVE